MTDLLERPHLTRARRPIAAVLAVIGICGAVTLGAGWAVHDGTEPPLIVHGVVSR